MTNDINSFQLCVRTWSKAAIPLAGALTAFVLAGCGSTSGLVVLPPVGPDAMAHTTTPPDPQHLGILRVYSARGPADKDVNFQEFFANDDFGGNRFPREPAHTDYTIFTEDGQVFARVHNARNPSDPQPTAETLPAGTYKIEAQAKDADPGNIAVLVPVTIQAGRVTQVHLDGDWRYRARPLRSPVSVNVSNMP